MREIITAIKQREDVLKKALSAAKRQATRNNQDGRLRITSQNGKPYYYIVAEHGDTKGKYIKKKNINLVKQLACKDYINDFLKDAQEELIYLQRVVKRLSSKNANLTYEKLSEYRKELVDPYILSDEEYAKNWEESDYTASTYKEDNKRYETHKGDRVRSKSEVLLANLFYDMDIPYRYEQALFLEDGSVRYPDFTLLHTTTRREFYLEHFGLLDDKDYLENAIEKLDKYRHSGIYLGKNLLITYETINSPLDIKGIKEMLEEMFGEK